MFQIPNTMKFPAICSINFHCKHTQNVSDKFFEHTQRLETTQKKAIVLWVQCKNPFSSKQPFEKFT